MTRKPAWRYICDFCGKSNHSGGHMARHERSCTANPNRVCRLHEHCEDTQLPTAELANILLKHRADGLWDQAIQELRLAASGCPACMLSAIRHSKMQTPTEYDGEGIVEGFSFPFNFKEEMKAFWDAINDAAYEREMESERHCL